MAMSFVEEDIYEVLDRIEKVEESGSPVFSLGGGRAWGHYAQTVLMGAVRPEFPGSYGYNYLTVNRIFEEDQEYYGVLVRSITQAWDVHGWNAITKGDKATLVLSVNCGPDQNGDPQELGHFDVLELNFLE
jgi:hypothetical protein